MSEPVWKRFLTERDKQVFAAAGYGTRQGYGKRPALLVVDVNYNFVEEGCFDRSQASHAISLCDMHAKYADVVKLDETLAFIESLPKGLFTLPRAAVPAAPKVASA